MAEQQKLTPEEEELVGKAKRPAEERARREALWAAYDALEILEIDQPEADGPEIVSRILSAFAAVKNIGEKSGIILEADHIVASACWCRLGDLLSSISRDEVNPRSRRGGELLIFAQTFAVLHAASNLAFEVDTVIDAGSSIDLNSLDVALTVLRKGIKRDKWEEKQTEARMRSISEGEGKK